MDDKKEHVHTWIIAEAWKLLESREDDDAENWRSYTEQHAPEALEKWGIEHD